MFVIEAMEIYFYMPGAIIPNTIHKRVSGTSPKYVDLIMFIIEIERSEYIDRI